MQPIYTAQATVTGEGRSGGHGETSDGKVKHDFSAPKEFGGPGGEGTNPEQLIAMGYAACFRSALGVVAAREHVKLDGVSITVRDTIGKADDGGFDLSFEVEGDFPNTPQAEAQRLMEAAHLVCPYSRAFRNGAPSTVTAKGQA
jgi:lipoyl-dependent peroxiredoxin